MEVGCGIGVGRVEGDGVGDGVSEEPGVELGGVVVVEVGVVVVTEFGVVVVVEVGVGVVVEVFCSSSSTSCSFGKGSLVDSPSVWSLSCGMLLELLFFLCLGLDLVCFLGTSGRSSFVRSSICFCESSSNSLHFCASNARQAVAF